MAKAIGCLIVRTVCAGFANLISKLLMRSKSHSQQILAFPVQSYG